MMRLVVVTILLSLLPPTLGYQAIDIPLHSFIQPVPEITTNYDVVHSFVLPNAPFVSSIPDDFYVKKSLRDKPRTYADALPQNTVAKEGTAPALPAVNNNGGIPTWNIQKQPALSGSDESQAAKEAKKPV